MTLIRSTSFVLISALALNTVSLSAAGFWDSIYQWFDRHATSAEKTVEKVSDRIEQTAQKVTERVEKTSQKTQKAVSGTTNRVVKTLVQPVVDEVEHQVNHKMGPAIQKGVQEVEKHAKPAIERAVKTAVEEAEKQAQPVLKRTEKRIQKNIAKMISRYSAAGMAGFAGFFVMRKVATCMTDHNNPGAIGRCLQNHDQSRSSLLSDFLMGAMIGMGAYGFYESMEDESNAQAAQK